ncbi:hypothetical protein I4F81_007574 [Pyropia yezoensis]|uniref:Uncharacterized protein n=1 Tax=Pyropia yezoensis TaxID=2788 RepID=A0ACC3C3Y2_PYRYE|nr:hypothetical protein I4F81_007574 [Neopyropia yezoensis]
MARDAVVAADVGVGTPGVTDLNGWMVARGHAFAYAEYSKRYVGEETAARSARLGVWATDGGAVSVQSRSAPGAAAAAAAEAVAECRRRGDERAAAGFTLALVQLRLAVPGAVDAAAVAADLSTVEATVGVPARSGAASAPHAGTADIGDRPPPHKRPRLPVPLAHADPDAALMRAALLCLRAVADLRQGDFPAVVAAAGVLSAAFNACSPSYRSTAVVVGAAAREGQPPPRPRWVWFHRRALRALLLQCSATALTPADPRGAVVRAADALAALGLSMPAVRTDNPGRLRTILAATSLSNLDADCRHALAAAAAEGAARAELTRCSLAAAAPYVRAVVTFASSISDVRAAVACSAAARLLTGQYCVLLGEKAAASTALAQLEGVASEPSAAGVPVGTRLMAAVYCSTLTGRIITEFLSDSGGEELASVSRPRAAENGQVDAAVLFAQSLVGTGGAKEGRRAAEQWAADAGDLTTLIRVAKAAKRSSRRHLDVDGARMAKDSLASLSDELSERQRLAPRW